LTLPFLVISNPVDKTDWWRELTITPLELEGLLKNFLVAGLAHGILGLLDGSSIQ